jgi:hypothetical protein
MERIWNAVAYVICLLGAISFMIRAPDSETIWPVLSAILCAAASYRMILNAIDSREGRD